MSYANLYKEKKLKSFNAVQRQRNKRDNREMKIRNKDKQKEKGTDKQRKRHRQTKSLIYELSQRSN